MGPTPHYSNLRRCWSSHLHQQDYTQGFSSFDALFLRSSFAKTDVTIEVFEMQRKKGQQGTFLYHEAMTKLDIRLVVSGVLVIYILLLYY